MPLIYDRSLANRTHPEYKIAQQDKFFSITACLNVWVSQPASRCITADIACTWHCQGVACAPIEPTSDSKLVQQENFSITASSNVWMSQPASRCITSDIRCTWHEQVVVVLQTERTSGSEIVWKDKFFASRQVQMFGCRNRPQDASHLTWYAHVTDSQS